MLALLELFGGQLSAIHFQKLLFLFTRQQTDKSFDFVPYKYGCFSFQANQDISTLTKYGFLEKERGDTLRLEKKDRYFLMLDMFDQQAMSDIHRRFYKYSQEDIVQYTYRHYPYFATKSVIANKVLNSQELDNVEKQKQHSVEPKLFTIGYEGVSLEMYLNRLICNDIHILCDVRKNAYSQKYGFSKSQLQTACEGVGIKYFHVPQLGIDSDKRQELHSQSDYDLLFDDYERTTLVQNHEALLFVRSLIDSDKRVALTCFEKDPKQCHRSRVAKALMALPDKQYKLALL